MSTRKLVYRRYSSSIPTAELTADNPNARQLKNKRRLTHACHAILRPSLGKEWSAKTPHVQEPWEGSARESSRHGRPQCLHCVYDTESRSVAAQGRRRGRLGANDE